MDEPAGDSPRRCPLSAFAATWARDIRCSDAEYPISTYVAWVGDETQKGLIDALTTWFGPPSAS